MRESSPPGELFCFDATILRYVPREVFVSTSNARW